MFNCNALVTRTPLFNDFQEERQTDSSTGEWPYYQCIRIMALVKLCGQECTCEYSIHCVG